MANEHRLNLEFLSNEVLFEILEYLDVYQLFATFYGLNRRCNDLIQQCHLRHSTINPCRAQESSHYYSIFIDKRFSVSKFSNLLSVALYKMNGFLTQVIFDVLPMVNQIEDIHIEHSNLMYFSTEATYKGVLLGDYHLKLK
ncbi:unnamed protein product [Rotaria magnacalcarata]|uniref:F-box domain-containing protein n=1 Tax=Rotaria magnacalcarata TaxID=392030 RepID=A0A814ST80_9BILA|nr:unnamed protein product [Rotaria magnacalcarata]CAF1449007.1 unnamed protein product [Rotaria magnacalcarata]CAF2117762.1 unnamed protein product [Rotaria magnacalcarata]CAF3953094.1 unnamed protein product [Rotaria magnacalcarata]CAF3957856.1 unnamed protein product [Rotaria magnacalcarata]